MYCVKCGVELADSEKQCPLCGTAVFHPEMPRPTGEKPYPTDQRPPEKVSPYGVLFVVTMLFALSMVITFLCDWQINGGVTWCGYAMGALLTGYVLLVLPFWFRHPNPVIFVPAGFVAIGLYLLYIDLATGGHWFLSFAFPVTGGAMLITTTVVTLTRYLRRGRLYIYGGALLATGAFMLLIEFLLNVTFGLHRTFVWAFYPLTVLAMLGVMLLVIAVCRPLRESLHRRFFL